MANTSYIRSNFRDRSPQDIADSVIQGSALTATAIGGGVVAGSFLPAAAGGLGGASNLYGGFIIGSFASLLNAPGWVGLSAQGVMSAYYGTVLGAAGSGWKWMPFFLNEASFDASVVWNYQLSATGALASVDSIVIVRVQALSISNLGSALSFTPQQIFVSAGGVSVRFLYAGFIVSTP